MHRAARWPSSGAWGRASRATSDRTRRRAGTACSRYRLLEASSARAPAGRSALYSAAAVSWYDDAGTTGCGFHAGYGVASRTLPCGTRLTFVNGGRSVTATVDDRGPYVYDREWDLNQNTAAALGFSGVGTVWVHG